MVARGGALAAVERKSEAGDHGGFDQGAGHQQSARLDIVVCVEIGQHPAGDADHRDQRDAQKGGRGGQDERHADRDHHQSQIEVGCQPAFVEQE